MPEPAARRHHIGRARSRSVASEVGRLEEVIVHRPGRELSRLTPANKESMLFDEIPWLERAQEEHDQLVSVLTQRGISVLYVEELLAETLALPEARREVIEGTCRPELIGPVLAESIAGWMDQLDDARLARVLIAGLTFGEMEGGVRSVTASMSSPEQFLLEPLPNHLFTRDSSFWVGRRPHVGAMAAPTRWRETLHMGSIYRHHPAFAGSWGAAPDDGHLGNLEGGDVLVLSESCLLVGVGCRTTAAAVEQLASTLLRDGDVQEVLAVELPYERAVIHLDTVITMVDDGTFTAFPAVVGSARTVRITSRDGSLMVDEEPDLGTAIARGLGTASVQLIATGGGPLDRQREQWSDANNVLAIAPGVVVAYDRNTATNERLSAAGLEVITVPSGELSRGRGGPRCLTCPTSRHF